MKNIFFISFLLILLSCKGQEKDDLIKSKKSNKMIEKLDIVKLKKEGKKIAVSKTEFSYELFEKFEDGSSFQISGSEFEGGFIKKETPALPNFYKIHKEFYSNGNLKKKEKYLDLYLKIETSEYYNEDGSLDKTIDEDKKFGKVKYTDVLRFLDEKQYIDLKTGKGREDEDGRPVFEISFKEENGKKNWYISIVKGKPNNNPENYGIGEPPSYLLIHYIMDGETGIVTNG